MFGFENCNHDRRRRSPRLLPLLFFSIYIYRQMCMKRLFLITLLIFPVSATAESFDVVSLVAAGRASSYETVLTVPENRINVSDEIISALTELEVQVRKLQTTKFSSRRNEQSVRLDYIDSLLHTAYTVDFYYDPKRVVCFGQEDLVRCFSQVGVRRESGMDREQQINQEPFGYFQQETFLRTESGGSLKPTRLCQNGKCWEVK